MSAAANEQSTPRAKMVHEDQLVNFRLNWLLISQTLLFGAYGILLQEACKLQAPPAPPVGMQGKVTQLLTVLPVLGIVVAGLIQCCVFGAFLAMLNIQSENHTSETKKPSERVDAGRLAFVFGWSGPLALPLVFICAWVAVLMA